MSIIASFLKIIVAGIYSIEALQAKQDQKSKALQNFAQTQRTESQRDQEQAPEKLLPFRSTVYEPETCLQQQITQVSRLFKDLSFGLPQQENGLLSGGYLQVLLVLSALQLILATEHDFVTEFLMKTFQVGVVLALISLQLGLQKEPTQLEQKLGLSALFLVASEYLQLYYQDKTDKANNDIRFSLVELLVYECVVTLSISVENLYTSSQLRGDSDVQVQGAINKLADSIFQDTTKDGTQAGYAILHVDTTFSESPEVCLLRYNPRLEKILQCCRTTDPHIGVSTDSSLNFPQVEDRSSSGSLARKQALTERLMNQFTSKQDTTKHQSALLSLSSNESQQQSITFKSIFMQKHTAFTQGRLSNGDKGEQLPKLFEEVFSCDNSNSIGGHGILKTKSHSDLKISLRVLCKESSCFFLKIELKSAKQSIKIKSSAKEMKESPVKKVSFNEFEKDAPRFSSRQVRKQKRDQALEVYRRQSRSLDDIQEILASEEKDKKDEKNEISDLDLCNSLNDDSQSVSSRNSKSESSVQTAQSLVKTGEAQTQTSPNSECREVLPLLNRNHFDNNPQSNKTPCFTSSRKMLFDFKDASNESNQMVKDDTKSNEKQSSKSLLPSIAELRIQIDTSQPSLQSSESIESENMNDSHPETRDKLIIKQQLLAARSCNNEIRRTTSNLMDNRESNTEIFVNSVMRNHTDVPVTTSEELKFNQVLKSKSPTFDQKAPWRSDEACPDLLSSLRGGDKDILNFNDSQLLEDKIRKQQALSMKNFKISGQGSNFFFPGVRSSNSFKLLSSQDFVRENVQRRSGSLYSALSGRICRTSIISDPAPSPCGKPISELQSVQSKQSKNSLQNAEAKIKANQLFVYKIIHDLRHPTDSVSQGLTDLVKELPIEKFLNDPNLRLNNENIYQYIAHDRVNKALQICNDEVSLQQSQSNKIQQSFSRSSSNSISGSRESNPHKIQTEKVAGRFFSSDIAGYKLNKLIKDEQPHFIDTMREGKLRRLSEAESEVINSQQLSIKEKMRKFYVDYNSIDVDKIELPKKEVEPPEEQKQLNHQEPQGPVEEEKEPLLLRPLDKNNGSGGSVSFGKNLSQSIENEEELQIDDNISEGSSKISCVHTGIVPQKKQFQREQVSDLVQKGIQNPSYKTFERKPFSLAADCLIFKSAVMEQIRNNQPIDLEKPKQRSKSCLTDVFRVMDSFKVESEQKFLSSKAMRSSGRINSLPIKVKPEQSLICLSDENQARAAQKKFESSPLGRIPLQSSASSSERNNSPALHSFFVDREKRLESNRYQTESARQDSAIGSKLRRSIKILQSERKYLVSMVNDLLNKTITTRNRIETMEGQTGMMMMLLRDLMNQAQLGNNTFTMVNEYFNVCSLIKRCIQLLKTQANLKNVQLSGPILEKQSDSCYFHMLFSDERRYSQFILNFLSNSIKFTPSGGHVSVVLRVKQVTELSLSNKSNKSDKNGKSEEDNKSEQSKTSSISGNSAPDKEILPDPDDNGESKSAKPAQNRSDGQDKKMVHFEMIFRDTGVGISPENQNRLFQNFAKVSESQELNKQGVGLGLSICKEIINAHGGSVDIESEMGKGTDFIINLKSKCIVDHNWQLTMHEDNKKNQLRIDDSNISPFMILEESEHSSAQASAYDPDCNNSDKQVKDDPNAWSQMQSQNIKAESPLGRRRSNSNKELPAKKILGDNNSQKDAIHMLRSLQKEQYLSTIDEGSQDAFNESSIGCRISRCLLANDDMFLLSAFEATLAAHFDLIDKVENGQAAVDAVKAQPINYYSVIVLDIQMPIMNGMEACAEILAHFQQQQEANSPKNMVPSRKASLLLDKSVGVAVHPCVYALTSEAEPEQILTIMKAGFRQIYNTIDQNMIRQILENANLIYQERIVKLNSDRSSRFDADKLSESSQSDKNKGNDPNDVRPVIDSHEEHMAGADSEWIDCEKKSSLVSDDQDQAPYQQ